MLLGFKRRFALYVWEGSKTHTIRGERANPPKVGETCHCYVDPRQKSMALLGRWECVKVEPITITADQVLIEGQRLSSDERNALAWRDGFRDMGRHHAFKSMMHFWEGRLPFHGQVIHWKYTEATRAAAPPLPGGAYARA